jgi:hypothetical protein
MTVGVGLAQTLLDERHLIAAVERLGNSVDPSLSK